MATLLVAVHLQTGCSASARIVDVLASAESHATAAELREEKAVILDTYVHRVTHMTCPGLARTSEGTCLRGFAVATQQSSIEANYTAKGFRFRTDDLLVLDEFQVIPLLKLAEKAPLIHSNIAKLSDFAVNHMQGRTLISSTRTPQGRIDTYYLDAEPMMVLSIAGNVVNEALFGGLPIVATTASRVHIAVPLREGHPWYGSQDILESWW